MITISRGRVALACASAFAMAGFAPSPAAAQIQPAAHAHVHGIATVDVAIDKASITISMSSPLDNLIGFEHAPHTDAEHSAAAKAVAALKQGSQVFSIDPAGGCKLKNVDLSSAALGLGQPSFYRDQGDNAWWSHASTPGVR